MSQPGSAVRMLSLSTVFPNADEPNLGLFVRARLQHLAALPGGPRIAVVAPIPVFDYSNWRKRLLRSAPAPAREDGLEVIHPRWLYPPFAGAWNGLLLFLQLLSPLAKLRRRFAFNLIDAHFAHPEGVAASMLADWFGCPFLITLRGNETKHASTLLRRWAIAKAIRKAGRVIAVSESLRRFAIELGARPERVVTIPNGIDGALYYPRGRAECRRIHGIDPNAPVLLSAGYLIERKGHHRVIHAAARLHREGIPVQVIIAGGPGREGKFETEIHRAVEQTGLGDFVRFTGHVTPAQLAELFSAADVFCLASNREGWPNVVNEAMACGVPVVATDVGGVPEMIPSPAIGTVVPAGDAGALEQALVAAFRRDWDRAAVAAWGRSRGWEQVAREVAELAALLVQERSVPSV